MDDLTVTVALALTAAVAGVSMPAARGLVQTFDVAAFLVGAALGMAPENKP